MITRIVKLTFKQVHVNEFFEVFDNSKENSRPTSGSHGAADELLKTA